LLTGADFDDQDPAAGTGSPQRERGGHRGFSGATLSCDDHEPTVEKRPQRISGQQGLRERTLGKRISSEVRTSPK
jgi:hypothetical protein